MRRQARGCEGSRGALLGAGSRRGVGGMATARPGQRHVGFGKDV